MKLSLYALTTSLFFAGSTQAATIQDYVDACSKNSNMGKEICECVANEGRNKLTDKGFDFFVATIQKNRAKSNSLLVQLDQSEVMTATMLTMKGPMDCANR